MDRALSNAYQMQKNSFNSNAKAITSFKTFATFLKDEFQIKDLRNVEKSHVQAFAEDLLHKIETEQITTGTAQNYLSNVNVALENARLDSNLRIDSVKDAGFPSKSGIATEDRSATKEQHENALKSVSEPLQIKLELQREFGLRFKESCLIDAKSALEQATTTSKIQIETGTKGGREREIPVHTEKQMQVLQRAAEYQTGRSLVPQSQSFREYQSEAYKEMRNSGITFHQERHFYANDLYEKLSGIQSPVRADVPHKEHHSYIAKELNLTLQEAKALDHRVRITISNDLGHGRIDVTNNYLG